MKTTKEEYQARKQRRQERLERAAARAQSEAEALSQQASQMASVIPLGQPILVGHYSERRDRNYRDRIDNKYRKAVELYEKADELESRAESAARNTAISTDDPEAPAKLSEKIAELEAAQKRMVTANKLIRKNDRAGLRDLGFSDAQIEKLFTKDFCNRVGFPPYALTNNSANIRRLKERLEHVKKVHAKDGQETSQIGEIKIVKNHDINRLQVFFPGKPNAYIRDALTAHGFHWSPSERAWQRMISYDAEQSALRIVDEFNKGMSL